MTGSYGMHAMLEENGNPERCFAGAVAGRLWPDRNPCPAPIICLTLHGSNLLPLSWKRDCRSRAGKSAIRRILSAPADSKVCFGMPENPAPETSALSAKAAVGSTPKSSNLKIKNAMAKKIKGRPRSADPCGTTSIRTPAVEIRHAAGYLAYILCNWVKYDAKLVRTITRESGARPYARP